MKKISISAAVVFLLLLSFNALKAQKDYVVKLTGDTIFGKIRKPFLDGLKFQETGQKDSRYITLDEYKAYYRSKDSTHYVAVKIPGAKKYEFLERMEYGKLQLFVRVVSSPGTMGPGGVMTGGSSTSTWYAGFDLDSLLEVKTNGLLGSRSQREKNFDTLIGTYPELLEDFKKEKDFSFAMIRAYVRKYNYYHRQIKNEVK